MKTAIVPASEVRAGQGIVLLGEVHRIISLREGGHPLLGRYSIATDARGWAIAIYPDDHVLILDETPETAETESEKRVAWGNR